MKDLNEKTISTLNSLIETCKDGAKGYKAAAEDAKDVELQTLFQQYAAERESFVRELQQAVRAMGGDPDKSGSVIGRVHRGWLDIKAAISSNEPHAVLAECERGEDAAVKAYRDASRETLSPQATTLILRQLAAVQAAHDRVRALRDSVVYQKT